MQFQYKPAATTIWLDLGAPLIRPPYLAHLDPATQDLSYGDFNLRILATDNSGNTNPAPEVITVRYADLSPPAAPQNLASLTQGNTVTLSWDVNSEVDLDGYNLYLVSGMTRKRITSSPVKTSNFQHQGLAEGPYLYEVKAVDIFGNESSTSNQTTALVYRLALNQPGSPVAVANISLTGSGAKVGDLVELFNDNGSGAGAIGIATADQSGSFSFDVELALGNNRITARGQDAAGNASILSPPVDIFFDEPPAPPTGLTGVANGYDVELNWDPNNEADLAGYRLSRDGQTLIAQSQITSATPGANVNQELAANAVDGDLATYWSNVNPMMDEWRLTFNNGDSLVKRIEIDWYDPPHVGQNFFILLFVDNTLHSLGLIKANTLQQNIIELETPVSASGLAINFMLQPIGTPAFLSEVRVYGESNLLINQTFTDRNLADGTYAYQVRAVDKLGLESSLSPEILVPVGDTTPPR